MRARTADLRAGDLAILRAFQPKDIHGRPAHSPSMTLSSPADHAGSSSTASQVFSLLPRAPTSLLLLMWIASLEEEDTRTFRRRRSRLARCSISPPGTT